MEGAGINVEIAVQQMTAKRDSLDGSLSIKQGLTNTNPDFIVVPDQNINLIPTDSRGLTFARTPQQVGYWLLHGRCMELEAVQIEPDCMEDEYRMMFTIEWMLLSAMRHVIMAAVHII